VLGLAPLLPTQKPLFVAQWLATTSVSTAVQYLPATAMKKHALVILHTTTISGNVTWEQHSSGWTTFVNTLNNHMLPVPTNGGMMC
jgi:hypothetical protein